MIIKFGNAGRTRRGWALIECIVLITLVTALLALCIGLIHLLLKLDRGGRSSFEESSDLARLARDFRADVHASGPVDPKGSGPVDRLSLPLDGGRAVDYEARADDVLRTVREGDKVRKRETYRRPARTAVRFDRSESSGRPFASLVFDRPADGRDDSLYRDYRIEAEVGKDRRLSGGSQ